MKILVVGLKTQEQLVRLQEEGEKRGHQVEGCFTSELVIKASNENFEVTLRGKSLSEYDLIYLWAVGRRRWEWYTTALFLNKNYGTKIVNQKIIDPSYQYYLSPAIDYLKQTQENILYPKSAILFHTKSVQSVIDDFSLPVIVKTSSGHQGRGVFKADTKEEVYSLVKKLKDEVPAVILREFIPNDGDIRIFTVGYKAIGAMKRTPTKEGEFRSNISQGGEGSEYDLEKTPKVKVIAEKLSKLLKTQIAGVDIMLHSETKKPYVLEINPGPQFMGLEKYTSINAALEIIKYFETLHA